ncbi:MULTISPECIES: hypothetical protein [unclassified Acinetobacter]|uniref:hypothetical protein n=1 Tax=unclassified Acinetobacter TaxID=196816 RepID=UPI0015D1E03C|nr:MULTISPECIES: hypothetical protein [unclassified Acinetobacter]
MKFFFKEKIVDFFSLMAVLILIISWLLPVFDGMKGYELFVYSFFLQFLIAPIILVFPIWANLSLVFTYFLLNENDPKSFRWSCITLAMMSYGLVTILVIDGKNSQPVLIGAYVWVFSGVLLCICAYIKVKKISKNH